MMKTEEERKKEMVKKVAGNDRESGWNLEWEEEKRRGRRGRRGLCDGMRVNLFCTNCVTQNGVMGWLPTAHMQP